MNEWPSEVHLDHLLLAFCDSAPFGVMVLDTQLRVLHVNKWLRNHKPTNTPEWEGQKITEILEPASEEVVLMRLEETLQIGSSQVLSFRFHPHVFHLINQRGDPIPQSVMVLPAFYEGSIVGAIILVQDASERLLSEEELKNQIKKLRALRQIDEALRTLDFKTCMESVVRQVRKFFEADFVALLLKENDALNLVASDGWELPKRGVRLSFKKGLSGWVASTGQSVCVNDVHSDPRYVALFPNVNSEMIVPLIVSNRLIGVLDVESQKPQAFNREDVELLELIGNSVAVALNNALIYSEVEHWQAFYRAVMDQTGDVIYTVDRQLRINNVNAAWDQFALQNGGEHLVSAHIQGYYLLDAIVGEERSKWQKICNDLLQGKISQYREEIPCHAPGKERWLVLKANSLRDASKKIVGIVFSTHDITDYTLTNRKLLQMNARLETLVAFANLLNQELNYETILEQAAERIKDLFKADCVTILGKYPQDHDYQVIAAKGASENHIREYRITPVEIREVIASLGKLGAIYNLPDTDVPNREILVEENFHGVLFAALIHKGEILGCIHIYVREEGRTFNPEEHDLLEGIAAQLSMAIANALSYREQQILASTDSLTGLYNRRKFFEIAAIELERSQRFKRPFCILMMDLDHFKDYNDTYGHQMGDRLLAFFGEKLRSSLRALDVPARYGGDEFVVLLPETGVEGGKCVAERLVSLIQKTTAETSDIPIPEYLSFSLGMACYPFHGEDLATILKRADQALYYAKRAGRGRYIIFQGAIDDYLGYPQSDSGSTR